jgi:hypothetical protein
LCPSSKLVSPESSSSSGGDSDNDSADGATAQHVKQAPQFGLLRRAVCCFIEISVVNVLLECANIDDNEHRMLCTAVADLRKQWRILPKQARTVAGPSRLSVPTTARPTTCQSTHLQGCCTAAAKACCCPASSCEPASSSLSCSAGAAMQAGQSGGCGSCLLHVHLQRLQDMQQGYVLVCECQDRTHTACGQFGIAANHSLACKLCCVHPVYMMLAQHNQAESTEQQHRRSLKIPSCTEDHHTTRLLSHHTRCVTRCVRCTIGTRAT